MYPETDLGVSGEAVSPKGYDTANHTRTNLRPAKPGVSYET